MLATAGFIVVIAGSKLVDDKVVESTGVIEELEIARLNNAFVIPVGRTGHIAALLWREFDSDLNAVYSKLPDAASWTLLNDKSASNEDVVRAIIKIMDTLRPA